MKMRMSIMENGYVLICDENEVSLSTSQTEADIYMEEMGGPNT